MPKRINPAKLDEQIRRWEVKLRRASTAIFNLKAKRERYNKRNGKKSPGARSAASNAALRVFKFD